MTAAPQIDVSDLNSVRKAAAELARAGGPSPGTPEVILGEDWVAPATDRDIEERRRRRGLITLNRSPLARKIITFNLIALILLVAGMLWFAPSRDNLAFQRASGLVSEAELVADVFEAQLPVGAPVSLATGDGIDPVATLAALDLRGGVEVFVFDAGEILVARAAAPADPGRVAGLDLDTRGTIITDLLNAAWEGLAGVLAPDRTERAAIDPVDGARALVPAALGHGTTVSTGADAEGRTTFTVATPIRQGDRPVGVLALSSARARSSAWLR